MPTAYRLPPPPLDEIFLACSHWPHPSLRVAPELASLQCLGQPFLELPLPPEQIPCYACQAQSELPYGITVYILLQLTPGAPVTSPVLALTSSCTLSTVVLPSASTCSTLVTPAAQASSTWSSVTSSAAARRG